MIRRAEELEAGGVREVCRIGSTGEALGEVVNLTKGSGLERLVVHHERLEPGRRASPPHSHSAKEEFVYVLRGTPTLWLDGRRTVLRANDSVAFATRTGVSHYLSNETGECVEYLVVSTPAPGDIVAYAT